MTIKLSANGQEITLMKLDKASGDLHSHPAKETKSLEKKGQDQLTNKTMQGSAAVHDYCERDFCAISGRSGARARTCGDACVSVVCDYLTFWTSVCVSLTFMTKRILIPFIHKKCTKVENIKKKHYSRNSSP